MAGTRAGGKKAAKTNTKLHGKNFYKEIGHLGGSKRGVKKGFALNPALARIAGARGGRVSRRGAGSVVKNKIEPRADRIEELYFNGYSLPQIAKKFKLPYSTLLKWAKTDLVGYGAKDDIERYEMMLERERGRNREDA